MLLSSDDDDDIDDDDGCYAMMMMIMIMIMMMMILMMMMIRMWMKPLKICVHSPIFTRKNSATYDDYEEACRNQL